MRINEGNPASAATFCRESMTTSTGSSDDDSSPSVPPSLPPLTILSIEDCVYRGEGNANVVVALRNEHKVIRFRKSLPDDTSPDGGKQRAEREVEFVKFVASCFLGPYTQVPEILRCDTKDIARLSEAIRPLRPDKRCNKDIAETYATKFPDYTFLQTKLNLDIVRSNDTYCVEIKPKQGYLRDTDRKFQKCPYCLSQFYKLKKRIIPCRSSYCPFDLFSGVEERMKAAIKGLLESPQNNLKIFKNGNVVYDNESSLSDLEQIMTEWFHNSENSTSKGYFDTFCSLTCAALLHPFPSKGCNNRFFFECELHMPVKEDLKSSTYISADLIAKAKKFLYFARETCNVKTGNLPSNSVLERILNMQRLPFTSSDYIYNMYLKLRPWLTDDMIYNNLIKTYNPGDHQLPCCKKKRTIEDSHKELRENYTETCAKDTSISRKSKLGDCNGNNQINAISENVSHISKSILFAVQSEKNHLLRNKSCIICNEDDIHHNGERNDSTITAENILYLQNYLLFTCARDCSILMSFREVNPNTMGSAFDENIIHLPNGLSFICNIQISDLDPKSLHCIEKHRQRDICALNSVISVLEEEFVLKESITI